MSTGTAWAVGDRADHVSGRLDSRPVADVRTDPGSGEVTLCLKVGNMETDPVPAVNYFRIPTGLPDVRSLAGVWCDWCADRPATQVIDDVATCDNCPEDDE